MTTLKQLAKIHAAETPGEWHAVRGLDSWQVNITAPEAGYGGLPRDQCVATLLPRHHSNSEANAIGVASDHNAIPHLLRLLHEARILAMDEIDAGGAPRNVTSVFLGHLNGDIEKTEYRVTRLADIGPLPWQSRLYRCGRCAHDQLDSGDDPCTACGGECVEVNVAQLRREHEDNRPEPEDDE